VGQEKERLSVQFCLRRLRKQTRDLSESQYPGDHLGPKTWLRLVVGLLDTADGYLLRSANAATEDDSIRLASDAAQLAAYAYHCLSLMRGSNIADLEYPIVPPLQRWLDSVGLTNSSFFRAELVANYELIRFVADDFLRIRDPAPSLTTALADIRWPLLRITVPSRAFAIIPHFAIVAHEVGHALYSRIGWDLTAFAAEVQNVIQRVQQRLGVTALSADMLRALQQVFSNWFEEMAADAFAAYLTGPAIFFSLADFFQLLAGGYGLSHTHPASDLRRRVLFEYLKQGAPSFATVFKRHTKQELTETFNSSLLIPTPSKDQIFNDLQNQYPAEWAAAMAELHESMSLAAPMIYNQIGTYLAQHHQDAIYTPLHFDEDLANHLLPLHAAVPPVEVTKGRAVVPAEFATILNVGWTGLLVNLHRLGIAGGELADKVEGLHDLLLKGVELAEVRRRWESV
jgi:hypothetical protein